MTDNEIIKALECSPLDDIGGCRKIDVLDLIKRQKAEIEQLKDLNAVLETDNFNANMNLEHIQYEFDLLKKHSETDFKNKCGYCVYGIPSTFGKSNCYVECTNQEHIAKYCKRPSSRIRQRTAPACRSYEYKTEKGGDNDA